MSFGGIEETVKNSEQIKANTVTNPAFVSPFGPLCQCPKGPCQRTEEWNIAFEVDPHTYPTSGLQLNLHTFIDCQGKWRYFPCEAKAEPIDDIDFRKLNYTLFPRIDPFMINIIHGYLWRLWKNGSKFEALRVQDWYVDVLRVFDNHLKENGFGEFRPVLTRKPPEKNSEKEFFDKMNLPYKHGEE